MKKPTFDVSEAHRYFSAHCFNTAWSLIEKEDRTSLEDETMIAASTASLWHWLQREDCTSEKLSIAYWQLSRVHAVLHRLEAADSYARLCQQVSTTDVPAVYLGFAHEAQARVAALKGNTSARASHESEARRIAAALKDKDERELLLGDLATLPKQG